ncbi:MAG: hypothetical protein KDD70_06720 [Bdellovibrionales bacterium]|nr:hypothetical protein [Bdellovibrionales bacterium]
MTPKSLLPFALFALLCGCSASVNRADVQAKSGSPLSAQIEQRSIPYEAGRPTAVVVVEPFELFADAYTQDNTLTVRQLGGGGELRAKLVTALTNVGNLSVLDPRGLKNAKDGTYSTRLERNEVGPYLIRVTVTEFSENIDATSSDDGFSLGWIGAIVGIAGAVTDKPGLLWPGAGLAIANPSYENKRVRRNGVVALDLQIVDGRTLRVVKAFKASGTFSAESEKSGFGLLGYQNGSEDFAQSVLGQATQAAFNDAIEKIADALV